MMKIVQRPRAGGKTYDLLQWMVENPTGVMVCIHRHAADSAHRQAGALGLDIERERFITVEQARRTPHGPKPRAVFDNVDLWLPTLLQSVDLEVVTFNGPHTVTASE